MPTVSPQQWNTNDAITSSKLNTPINQIAAVLNGGLDDANVASLSGSKLNAATVPVAAFTADSNPETRMSESLGDFVKSNTCLWSISSGLVGTMTAGVVYIGGKRVVVAAIATRTFTASKDTYVSVDNTGTVSYSEVANNAAAPTLPANSIWLAVIVTGASAITSIRQGGYDSNFKPVYPFSSLLGAQQAWQNATLQNGWVVFGAPYPTNVGYMKDSLGFVHTRGLIKSGTATQNTVIFTLPIGYRPSFDLYIINAVAGNWGIVHIGTNGNVMYDNASSATTAQVAYSLDNIHFRAEL